MLLSIISIFTPFVEILFQHLTIGSFALNLWLLFDTVLHSSITNLRDAFVTFGIGHGRFSAVLESLHLWTSVFHVWVPFGNGIPSFE